MANVIAMNLIVVLTDIWSFRKSNLTANRPLLKLSTEGYLKYGARNIAFTCMQMVLK